MEDVTNRLPGGGLIKNALHEVRPLDPRDGPAATAFLLGLAARLGGGGANDAGGLIVWIRPQDVIREWGLPYAPGLAPFGLNPARCLFIYPRTEQEALWAVEEAVQSRGVRLVLAEVEGARLDLTASRRIHLTAEKVAVPALIARSGRATQATAALTRWAVGSAPSARPAYGARGIGARRWHVELERARGGRPGAFEMEWDHEAYHFRLVAPLADRSAEAGLQPANENIAVA